MKAGGIGGDSTGTGLKFEAKTDLRKALATQRNVTIQGDHVFLRGVDVGLLLQKHAFYRNFLEPKEVKWQAIISKQLLPDDALFVPKRGLLTVIEKKFQQVEGSVDEKLQTCDFKRRQYVKLVKSLGITVRYTYVLNEWFTDARYRDVLQYIRDVSCFYFFERVPLDHLGIG